VIQVYPFAALRHDAGHRFMEPAPGNDGAQRHWWKVDSADVRRSPVSGWVREQSFEGGRVTREYAQSWIDFECHGAEHDRTHTIFATAADYVDYATGSEMPGAGSLAKLSPLMAAIYRAVFPEGDGRHAADDLCSVGRSDRAAGFPWAAFRASRMIARHESEWANPAKWQALVSAIGKRTGPKPAHEEQKKRIAKLVWWDEVAAGVPGFPAADVYHINPIGLVGNFARSAAHPFVTIRGQRIELQFLWKSDGQSLREKDYADAAADLGCDTHAIKAVAKTETGSSGSYFKPGRDLALEDDPVPAILFERHLFHRATHGKYDQSHPHISNSESGGYGVRAVQYDKLMEAYALDPEAALLSTSWGRFPDIRE